MRTSIGCFTLAILAWNSPAIASAQEVVWKGNYQEGRTLAQQVGRPLAVFVGGGTVGHQLLTLEGVLSAEVRKILAQSYVCVYLDTQQSENQELLRTLAIHSGHGLILSDPLITVQAFHHDGRIGGSELTSQLSRFAVPGVRVTTTTTLQPETLPSFQTISVESSRQSFYPPLTNQEVRSFVSPNVGSQMMFAPRMAPAANC